MRFLFVASIVSFVVAGACFACSSGTAATGGADAGKDAKAAPKTEDDDDDITTSPPITPTDGGDTTDASDAAVTSTTTDAGHVCKTDSTPEAEPNNDVATATKLTPTATNSISFCGQVATGDTDVFTFTHPFAGAFKIVPSGDQVKYATQIGDKTFSGFPQKVNVTADDVWVVTVTSNSTAGRSYAVQFIEDN